MAANEVEIQSRVLHWVENESDFEADNHVIKKGEQIVILKPIRRKFGDGTSTYNELPFDTNHHKFALEANISTFTLYNVIPQTTFVYRRSAPAVTDMIFLLDSFKDSNRGFGQLDGRIHKIYVENGYSNSFEVEVDLTSLETSEGSTIHDIGIISVPSNSFLIIEFCWFTNVGGNRVCFCRASFDDSRNFSFYNPTRQNTSGTSTVYNNRKRQYIFLEVNISSSTLTFGFTRNEDGTGSPPPYNVEHYYLVKNISGSTKLIAMQCIDSGVELIVEGGSSTISLDNLKAFEFSYIWVKRGTTDVCVVTKSNILTTVQY